LTSDNYDWYTTECEKLADKYAIQTDSIASMDFNQWAKDSYDIAVDDVYAGKSNALNFTFNSDSVPVPIDFVEDEIPS